MRFLQYHSVCRQHENAKFNVKFYWELGKNRLLLLISIDFDTVRVH